ncbi:MAG: hypothetical protein QM528_03525 [Phycisphaerales bacterium]|nr:hypothetical protein [Phycisphaerales bacterium]
MNEIQPEKFALQNIAFVGRTFKQLCELFDIKDIKSLEGKKVLDCPGGPSGLNRYFKDHQIHCVSVDPLYNLDIKDVSNIGKRDVDLCDNSLHAVEKVSKIPVSFDFFKESHNARQVFIDDFELGKAEGRYVVGQLPKLSFKDKSFDIALSANLLFLYAPKSVGGISADENTPLDYQWHLDSILELMRIAKQEVRIGACAHFRSSFYENRLELHPWTKRIIDELHDKKIKTELVKTPEHTPRESETYMLRIIL